MILESSTVFSFRSQTLECGLAAMFCACAQVAVVAMSVAQLSAQSAGPPAIKAKGLKQVQLLKTRPQLARLDVWPFLALYCIVIGKAAFHASKFEW